MLVAVVTGRAERNAGAGRTSVTTVARPPGRAWPGTLLSAPKWGRMPVRSRYEKCETKPHPAAGYPPMRLQKDLSYPPRALVLVAGLPGAGKSTLLLRLYGMRGDETQPVVAADGVRVIDSRQARNWWAPRLGPVPQRAMIPLIYGTHVWRIVRALVGGHAVVAHTRGTWPHILYGFAWLARRLDTGMYLILLDVPPQAARDGQHSRGRVLTARTFARHCRRWQSLMTRAGDGSLRQPTGVTVLDRAAADRLEEIRIIPRQAQPRSSRS